MTKKCKHEGVIGGPIHSRHAKYICLECKKEWEEDQSAEGIGYLVWEKRKERKLTQKQLAEKMKLKQPEIARLENGKQLPSLDFLYRIADALECNLEIKFITL